MIPFIKKLKSGASALAGIAVLGSALCALPQTGLGQVSFTGSYTNNFDSMGTTGTTPPVGWSCVIVAGANTAWASSIPASGSPSVAATATVNNTLAVNSTGTGSYSSGTACYNLALSTSTGDRCLGSSPTGTAGNILQLRLLNNSGAALSGIQVGYDIRRFTAASAANELPGFWLFYSVDNGITWVNVSALNPVLSGGAVNVPNTVGVTTVPLTTVTLSSAVAVGAELRLRWVDDNAVQSSPDQVVGLDNVSVQSLSLSTPPTLSAAAGATVDAPVTVTFTDNAAWRAAITSITVGGTTLSSSAFTIAAGQITFAPSVSTLLQSVGSKSVVMIATGYGDDTVSQSIGAGAAAKLGITTQPAAPAVNGGNLATQPVIAIQDQYGNATTSIATVTASVGAGTWTLDGGGTSVNAVNGTATFTGLTATSDAGLTGVTIRFSASGLAGVTSSAFNIPAPTFVGFMGSYFQNFDQDLTNSSTLMPEGFSALGLAGDHFTFTNGIPITSSAIATASAGVATLTVWNTGTAVAKAGSTLFNVGGCGASSLNDRSLGTDPTGNGGTVIQLALRNNTGSSLPGVVFSYDEKCLTNGSTSNGTYTDDGTEALELPGYSFFYSTTGGANASDWVRVDALSLTNWAQGTVSNSGSVSITFPTPLPANGIMYFRWADDNCVASSPDQMYSIDNIFVTTLVTTGPAVSLCAPANNALYPGNATLPLSATVSDASGNVTNVAFYQGSTLLFNVTTAPFSNNWANVPLGNYALTAVATDNNGLSATSAVVNVSVITSLAVSLTSPANNASFTSPATVSLAASASDLIGTITGVTFYQGSTAIGSATTAPYTFSWTGVQPGNYALTAVVSDNGGLAATSSVVNISVVAPNLPPSVTIASPADGATKVSLSPALGVNVSDPEGSTSLTVSFYGRAAASGGTAAGPDFTIVALPDTQNYCSSYPQVYTSQTDWIVSNRVSRNLVYVVSEGDIVNTASSTAEYQNATNALYRLENPVTTGLPQGIPWGCGVGNHDQPTTLWNQYFGVSHFAGRSYYGGHYSTSNDSHYDLISVGGMDFIVLYITMGGGSDSSLMAWANSVLQTYSSRRAIVMSHSILNVTTRPTPSTYTGEGQPIFDSLKGNTNLFLMLCGHMHGEGFRHEVLPDGRVIDILLADYQDYPSGGNGLLRCMTFSPSNNVIHVSTYSPYTSSSMTGPDSQFDLSYTMSSVQAPAPYTALGTKTGVPSGTQATLTWPGLGTNTTYQWYATVSDGQNTVTSTVPQFTTCTNLSVVTAGNEQMGTARNQSNSIVVAKLLKGCSSSGGYALSITGVSATSLLGGTVRLTGSTILYTSAANVSGTDSFTYTVADTTGASAQGVVTVQITVPTGSGPNVLGIATDATGATVSMAGIPNTVYQVQASTNLINWQNIGTSTAGFNGLFQFLDVSNSFYSVRFYRSTVNP